MRIKADTYCGKARVTFVERDHVPDNKRRGEVDSYLSVEFLAQPGAPNPWLSVCMTEVTTSQGSGRSAQRSITATFDADAIAALKVVIAQFEARS